MKKTILTLSILLLTACGSNNMDTHTYVSNDDLKVIGDENTYKNFLQMQEEVEAYRATIKEPITVDKTPVATTSIKEEPAPITTKEPIEEDSNKTVVPNDTNITLPQKETNTTIIKDENKTIISKESNLTQNPLKVGHWDNPDDGGLNDMMERNNTKFSTGLHVGHKFMSAKEIKETVDLFFIRHHPQYVTDTEQYGDSDYYEAISEANGWTGDCEDWALGTMIELIEKGEDPKHINMRAVMELSVNRGHMFLEIDSPDGIVRVDMGGIFWGEALKYVIKHYPIEYLNMGLSHYTVD